MSFQCNDCKRTIRTVSDIRNCSRCQSSNRAASIPEHHEDTDWLTPALIGYAPAGAESLSNAGLDMNTCKCQAEYIRLLDEHDEWAVKLFAKEANFPAPEWPEAPTIACERLCEKAQMYAVQCLRAEASAQRQLRHSEPKACEPHSRLLALVHLVTDCSLFSPFGKIQLSNVKLTSGAAAESEKSK